MRSVMPPQHSFSKVPQVEIPRSTFNRSHGYKTTFDGGYLIPIFVDEALPGDTFILSLSAFMRMSTPILPIMDNIRAEFFFFSVPLRLIQDNFQKLMGEQVDPGDSIAYLCPTIDIENEAAMSLTDYLGCVPELSAGQFDVVSYHHRAYNLIYNEWFRDQNLVGSVVVDKDDGPDAIADYILLQRGKRHDYFTSSLPWPQKGDAVELPLGTEAPIFGDNMVFDDDHVNDNFAQVRDAPGGSANLRSLRVDTAQPTRSYVFGDSTSDGTGELKADLSGATAATVNELRQAFQIQKLLERDARGGTRYIEKVKVHFGVTSPDLRATRPQFLGGGSLTINQNAVPRTNDFASNQGADLSSFATGGGDGIGFTASFTEHCALLGLVSVDADLTYQQGIDRMFFRSTQYDFYFPVFAHIGEQAVLNREIFVKDGDAAYNADVWGYQERYAEYRYKPSKITGLFRSDATGSIDEWHCSQDLSNPVLNSAFIHSTPPFDRNIATPTEPHFIYDSFINLKCIRPMPVYGVPGLIDHL